MSHLTQYTVRQLYNARTGEHIENTLEALTALIQRDNNTPGGLKTLAYVEFDIHVSALCRGLPA